MSVHDAVHRGDVPPPIDLAGHMRELGRALLPAVIIAALVGAGVFYLRSELTEKQYAASIVTEIEPVQTLVPGDAFIEQMRAPFIELATDRGVLDQVLSQVDAGGMDAAELASSVELSPGTSPALLTVTVTTRSPELAADLAEALVSTMATTSSANAIRDSQERTDEGQSAIDAQQSRVDALPVDDPSRPAALSELAELRTRQSELEATASGDRLVVLSNPEQSTTPVSPKPVSEALVAALAALIVAAELIVLLRGRFGRKPSRSWARRVSRKYGAHFDPATGDTMPPAVASRIAALERGDRPASRGARHAAPKGESVVLLLVGEGADFESTRGPGPTAGHHRATAEFGLSEQWWHYTDVGDVETVVVLVSKRGRDKKAATTALRRLNDFAIPVHLVLQNKNSTRRVEQTAQTIAPEGQRDAS
ncbi:YveK family protein [Rhodococcoides navarretei]|uniref:Capsular polysaccharide biosynthesis protein n=1 Tax=Rhodococcus navarretei TaxID=3128981 RepID=A0ABU9CW62_9NOCA